MRKRTKAETHAVKCYKFRAFLKENNDGLLPTAIYNCAQKQRKVWNDLAIGQATRWQAWKDAHPPVGGPDGKPKFTKPDKTYWQEWESWMRSTVAASDLGWEAESDIIDRFSVVLRRLSKSGGAPKPRRFDSFSIPHRYSGGGIALDALASERAKRFRIVFSADSAYANNSRESRRERIANAWFGVDGDTVALSVPMHRQIPSNAIIKGIRLVGWKQSPAMRWMVHIVITVEEPKFQTTPCPVPRTVALDVGWRKLENELRVAVAYDGSQHFELRIPLRFTHKALGEVSLDRKRGCQQVKDALLERCKKDLKTVGLDVPTQARNGWLIRFMRESPQHSGLTILEKWKRDNDMLQRKVLMLENAMTGRREHLYREFAAKLVNQYDVIKIENLDLPEMNSVEQTKDNYALEQSVERRKLAACGTLIASIKNAAQNRGKRVEEIEAAWTTGTCSDCGGEFEAGAALLGRCKQCQRQQDQDWTAAKNIYAKPPVRQTEEKFATIS